MKRADKRFGKVVLWFAAICLSGACMALPALEAEAAPDIPQGFDGGGEKIFKRYDETPLAVTTGTDGRRTLNRFYELRQYPGSPPRVPHEVSPSFKGDGEKCLSCHGRGGFSASRQAYVPVSPHPEYESCFQCHVPQGTEELFVDSNWLSMEPPRLGRSAMGGSPPAIPHALQLREDCLACHTGNGAVAEIRVEHASRGNCRQCHVPQVAATTGAPPEFSRDK
ncbi:MAG: nitrate reductase cytochrome c-type subunit [Thermodesulfobacteriota bacterium]